MSGKIVTSVIYNGNMYETIIMLIDLIKVNSYPQTKRVRIYFFFFLLEKITASKL